ncbi:MAG: hypothetical protein JNM69_04570 [Archangium sp.]|nr:hypothetical protein [Archangium sp.]
MMLGGFAAFAQNQRPVPVESPDVIVGRSVRVHVVASEELEPDVLRALAKPQVVLWLTTGSNTLRESTLETLNRFESSFVQLRTPVAAIDGKALKKSPRAGLWLSLDANSSLATVRGSRALALEVTGSLDEVKHGWLLAQRPTFIRWAPAESIDLLQWIRFKTLPGRKTVVLAPGLLLPRDCATRDPGEPSAELHVATLLAVSAGVFPCGAGTRVEVPADVEPWLLKSLIVRDPSVELVVRVGDDVRKVGRARALLELLGR